MDIKITCLNNYLEESAYMVQPTGYIVKGNEHQVCKLLRSIYMLKQVSRSWNQRFDQAIKTSGLEKNIDEPCVYKRIGHTKVIFLVLYVEDILLIGNDVGTLSSVKLWLTQEFNMNDLKEANFVLVIQIMRDRKNKVITLSSAKQSCTVDSTMETEHVAAAEATKEAIWLQKFLTYFKVIPIIEAVADRIVDVVKVSSEDNLADLFTKTLLPKSFEKHVESIRM
ncbi:gag/pol protein [Gossypium australe]|uniref:Gag/pol protein n=1 Tax=Gossypium australe TaxID=47621 RepID=A0A5B6UYI7_9ROSI|nr:gag/pol protein [Gossypium australe]